MIPIIDRGSEQKPESLYDDRMLAFSISVLSSRKDCAKSLYDDRLVAFSKSVLSVGMPRANPSMMTEC